MKLRRRIGSVFLAFAMALSLIPSVAVSALAADENQENEYISFDYGSPVTGSGWTYIIRVLKPDGSELTTLTVNNYARGDSHENKITLLGDIASSYEISSISQSTGVISSQEISQSTVTYRATFTEDSATLTVQLAEVFNAANVQISGDEITNFYGDIYYSVSELELLKMLGHAGIDIPNGANITGVTLRYVESNNGMETRDFTEVEGVHAQNFIDYWRVTLLNTYDSNGGKAIPQNIRQIEITYDDGKTAVIPYSDLTYTGDSSTKTYTITARAASPYIVAFYNENDTAAGNDYNIYAVRFVEQAGTSLGEENMPTPPIYEMGAWYEFVAWTETYDGGMPFLSTTVVNEDTVVYAQKALNTIESRSPWIHVMNNNDLLKERIAELYGVGVNDIAWDRLRIAVYGETDDIHTNPEYGNQGGLHNKWDSDAYEHFDILNFSTGAEGTDWENNPIHANDITKIGIYVVNTDGTQLEGPKFIKKGLYDGDFAVSTGKGGSDALIELYINSDEYPDDPNEPDPGPTEPAITDFSKDLVDSAEAATEAGITGTYTFPNEDGKVIIPYDESVTLLYAITVTGKGGTTFSVTDTGAQLVTVSGVSIDQSGNDFTGTISDTGSITFYVSKTFNADDITEDGKLTNTAELIGDNAPAEGGEDTEVVDAEEETNTVYVYVQFVKEDGSALSDKDKQLIKSTYGTGLKEDGYMPIGYFDAAIPSVDGYDHGADQFSALLGSEFVLDNDDITAWATGVNKDNLNLAEDVTWTKLSVAYGALDFGSELDDNCWHLDGKITLSDIPQTPEQVTITYYGNGGSFTNQWGTHTKTNETGTYGSEITLYNTTYYFQREGYTNLGWSTTENGSVEFLGAAKVTLNEDTFPGLSETNHIDLYAVWEKNAPTFEELSDLGLKVTIDCVSNVGHDDGYVPLIESTPNNPTCVVKKVDSEADTYEVWVEDPDDYIAQYNQMDAAGGYTHKYVGFNGAHYFTVQWDSTTEKWVATQDKVTILAKCMPEAPTEDALKALLDDAVKVQCVEVTTHNCTFDVKEGYTVSGPTADGKGGWTYTVTVTAEPYVTDFNTKNVGEHWLVDDEADTKDIVLTWDADHNTWTRQEQVEFDVTCKPEPVQTYKIDVVVTNGTGTFRGAEVTTHILAMEGENITIAFAPDAGYALDTVTVDGKPAVLTADGTYTFTNVAADHSITVVYATDAWNDEDDTTTGGDSIPDYKQVLIEYTTDGNGTVSPTTQVETLVDNADGKYVGTVNVVSTATANEGYAFAFWMGPNDSTFWSKDLNTTLKVEGGKTYTYTATFGTDLIGPEDPTGEDPDNPGDGIPDKYQVVVKYVADTGGKITGKQVEVLTIYDADGHYSTVGDVTATGSQAAAFHNWDFSRWVAPNGGVAGWNPTLDQQIIKNAVGGGTYVFTALFRYDPYTPPVVEPDDPTPPPVDPDKPQLNTEDHYAYIVGYEDGTVRPEGDITRAEVATIFFRLLTDESRDEYWSQTNDYTDVAEGDWYNNAVSTLSKAGILNGYEDGSFRPNGNITRAEFATIAARFFEATYEGEDLFPDIKDHWARDYINQAAHAGIVNGYEDGTFRPQDNITRAEAMTIVNRTLDRHPDADHFLDNMVTWPDNPEDAWYYEQVQEATNSHEYIMKTDADKNSYEIWKEILPVRDWSDLENTWSEAHAG